MFVLLVLNQSVNVPIVRGIENGKKNWKISLITNIQAQDTQIYCSLASAQKYSKKLKSIIGHGEDGNWTLECDFEWSQSHPKTMYVRLSGHLLERLQHLCGEDILLTLEAQFVHRRGGSYGSTHMIKLTTSEMGIFSPSTMLVNNSSEKQDSLSCSSSSSSGQETFCEDIHAQLSDGLADVFNNSSRMDTLNATVNVRLEVEDEYINYDRGNVDKMSVCRNIFHNSVHSDVSIVAANGSIVPCHKCFLASHSSVLKAALENNFEESKSNEIKMEDVSEECVMALLEFIYTWEITDAIKSSELAVELFQVAHKYDIKPLEKELAQMFLQRGNKWFKVDAALELFRFARKIETCSVELKAKAVKTLKSKRDELLKTNGFKKLFIEDWETALELCSMALQS